MHLNNNEIKKCLKQGKEFIFVASADIEFKQNIVYSNVCVPEKWGSRFVSSCLIVEAIGQTIELLIRKVYGVSGSMYLAQIKKVRNYNIIQLVEQFQNIRIISEATQKINNCFISAANAFMEDERICYVEIYHYIIP